MCRYKLKKYGKSNDYIKIIKKRKITSYSMEGKTWNEVNNENENEVEKEVRSNLVSPSSIGQESAA